MMMAGMTPTAVSRGPHGSASVPAHPHQPAHTGKAMALDAGCVLAAWAIGYLLRLGIERMHVVTWFPEVAFIIACAVLTVLGLRVRRLYTGFPTHFSRADAPRLALTVLLIGYGLSAVVRFFDVEIISRTAIALAPVLSLGLMFGWRLAADQFFPQRPYVVNAGKRALIVVNLDGRDLTDVLQMAAGGEVEAQTFVFGGWGGADAAAASGHAVGRAGRDGWAGLTPQVSARVHHSTDTANAYAAARDWPEAVIALPSASITAWRQDARYHPHPGHKFVAIETLQAKAQELAGGVVVH